MLSKAAWRIAAAVKLSLPLLTPCRLVAISLEFRRVSGDSHGQGRR